MLRLLLLHDLSVQVSWLALKNANKAGFGRQTKLLEGIAGNCTKCIFKILNQVLIQKSCILRMPAMLFGPPSGERVLI
jgi:hypothetical protein